METNQMKKAIAILLVVLFLVTVTVSAVSARNVMANKHTDAVSTSSHLVNLNIYTVKGAYNVDHQGGYAGRWD